MNIIRFLHETSPGFTNLARKFCLEYSSEKCKSRREFGNEIFWSLADFEELEKMDTSEIYLQKKYEDNFIFPVADDFRVPTQSREQPAGSEDLSGEIQGEPEGPQPTESKDDAEALERLLVDLR